MIIVVITAVFSGLHHFYSHCLRFSRCQCRCAAHIHVCSAYARHSCGPSGERGCGGSDITSLAVFAAPAEDEQSSKSADADADAAAACQLLLVYASSTFADERVSCRAKLLQLHGNGSYDSSSSSWRITTEVDLLHPPSKDTPHFDVTCIAGCRVRRRAVADCKFVIIPGRGMCFPATSAATSLLGHCSLI